MKKLFLMVALLLIACFCLAGCNGCNKTIFDFDYKFTKATYFDGEQWKTVDIARWKDWEDSDILQIELKDGTIILTHSSNVILKSN
jgi:hypothetical protein